MKSLPPGAVVSDKAESVTAAAVSCALSACGLLDALRTLVLLFYVARTSRSVAFGAGEAGLFGRHAGYFRGC